MKQKINNIVDWFLIGIVLLGIPLYFLYLFNRSYQLTERSFEEINLINCELQKLDKISANEYKTNDELLFDVYNIIGPNFIDEHYFLKSYVSKYNNLEVFYPKISDIKESISNEEEIDFSSLEKSLYFELDSLINDIYEIVDDPSFQIKSWHTHYYYKRYYSVPSSNQLIISDKLIVKLHEIKDVSFKTNEEFEQECKKLIGIYDYNQISGFLNDVIDNFPMWQRLYLRIILVAFVLIILVKIAIAYLIEKEKQASESEDIEQDISNAKKKIKETPNEVLPVWDLANATLQKYYNKNIEQVNSIYKLSIAVMIMGFLLIVSILIAGVFYDKEIKNEDIGIIAGIITEFIGATFLFIYKSTITQAIQHSKSLEKINNVGMSIKIIESIENNETNQKDIDGAKIEIAKELITTHNNV